MCSTGSMLCFCLKYLFKYNDTRNIKKYYKNPPKRSTYVIVLYPKIRQNRPTEAQSAQENKHKISTNNCY